MASANTGSSFLRALEQPLVLVDVERGEAGRGGQRMARVGVAVEQLHHVLGARS